MQNIYNLIKLSTEKCVFCNFQNEEYRILYKGKFFYIMAGIGPIIEGYCFIVPYEHIACSAEFRKEMIEEFNLLKFKLENVLKKVYFTKKIIAYEHGRSGSCLYTQSGTKHCYHAHRVYFPVNIDILPDISKELLPIEINNWEELIDLGVDHYLFYQNNDGKQYYFPVTKEIPSQFLRKCVASKLGYPNKWDWNKYQDLDIMLQTVNKLKPYFNYKYSMPGIQIMKPQN